ncbi:MAG: hypothetical protein K2M59_01165 [Muribaculaceae bacterium]|nr:hypothetical protein [Muribaculaceae bacterium]
MRCTIIYSFLFISLAMLSSCKTGIRYVPVERVRTEYIAADTTAMFNRLLKIFESRKDKEVKSDSLVDRTKETVVLNEKGDTTRHDKERIVYRATAREKELENKIAEQDSIICNLNTLLISEQSETDPIPVEVEKEVNKLYWWQKSLIWIGGIFLIGIPVAVWWLIRKKK